ncbi:MAG TPA: response regulator transcription factor [Candidatus Ozemobacteraceae bacterium]|nr:response regulator transcription factor [Candidatus Ozemobacteraceae bacterium]
MKNITILDDDVELCELLSVFLKGEGFTINVFNHPDTFFAEGFENEIDLLILDVMLPGMNGFEILKKIRAKSGVPVIMLTARGEDVDRIIGLELGADDYLAKPFNPRELAARIRAIARRAGRSALQQPDRELLLVGDVKLNPASRRVFVQDEEIHLTSVEFKLLEVLMRAAGSVVRRQDLATQVLERTLAYEDRSLDVHVSNLRRKLGNTTNDGDRIQTVRGNGYLFAMIDDGSAEK